MVHPCQSCHGCGAPLAFFCKPGYSTTMADFQGLHATLCCRTTWHRFCVLRPLVPKSPCPTWLRVLGSCTRWTGLNLRSIKKTHCELLSMRGLSVSIRFQFPSVFHFRLSCPGLCTGQRDHYFVYFWKTASWLLNEIAVGTTASCILRVFLRQRIAFFLHTLSVHVLGCRDDLSDAILSGGNT